MDRREFYFLYVNLNSLADLALWQLAAKLLAQPSEVESQAPLSQENLSQDERDARILASFENLDFSALDDLNLSSITTEADGVEAPPLEPAVPATSEQAIEGAEEIDVERYLARAYSHEEQLRERIDSHYLRADLPAMKAALLQLPSGLRMLTGPLSATDVVDWLALYDAGNTVLIDLTTEMRRLDISAALPP